jgi:ribonuclease HI
MAYQTINNTYKGPKHPFPSPVFNLPLKVFQSLPNVITNIGLNKKSNQHFNSLNQKFLACVNEKWPTHLKIYTDGSKIDSKGFSGSAYVIPKLNLDAGFKLPPEASVYSAECFALKEALRRCLSLQEKHIIVFSDSLSLVKCLASPQSLFCRNQLIIDIRLLLFRLKELDRDVVIAWIPAHCGIYGNERADVLAKRAVQGDSLCNDFITPECDSLNALERKNVEDWYTSWQGSPKGSHYKKVQASIPSRPWFHKRNLSRHHIVTITRLRFGHIRLDSHLFRFGLSGTPYCECGWDEETPDHVLFGCPLRDAMEIYFKFEEVEYPLCIDYLLGLNSHQANDLIFQSILKNMILI